MISARVLLFTLSFSMTQVSHPSNERTTGVRPDLELAVVVPVYNEQDSIRNVLEEWCETLKRLGIRFCVFAYDDGSKDDSSDVLRAVASIYPQNIKVISKQNSGHGPTILRGYKEVAPLAEWIFQMDSDNEMSAKSFSQLWERRTDYDFLLGCRQGRRQPIVRCLVSLVSRLVIRCFYGSGTGWDVNSPYRLMRSSAFKSLFQMMPGNTFAPNLIVSGYVARKGLNYSEIPVPHKERQTGEVSIKKWKLLKAAVRSFYQTISFSTRFFL